MRDIRFRGKRLDNGEWVYGYLVIDRDGSNYIVNNYGDSYTWDQVDPSTVGQFTGLLDKNGKEIYDGDIVHYKYQPGENMWNNEQNGIVKWHSTGWYFNGLNDNGEIGGLQAWFIQIPGGFNNSKSGKANLFEIIGNIHDKPDLMKG